MEDIIRIIKNRVSMKEVLAYYGQHPVGSSYRCFAHDDHRPSASIMKKGDKYHCFSCGWTGDVIDVVRFFERCDSKKAIKVLNENFHLGVLEELSVKDKRELKKMQEQRDKERKEREHWEKIRKDAENKLMYASQYWRLVNAKFHPTKSQIEKNTWTSMEEHIFYKSLKMVRLIDYLNDVVMRGYSEDEELYCIYGNDRKDIIKKIVEGEIKI